MDEQLVLDAVRHKPIVSSQGILQKLFAVWFDAFIYNQIWEDPRVDLDALELNADSRILTISSGGCNVLNYALAGPLSITAVDLNRHHIALLDLKTAAAAALDDHEDFFTFFGYGRGDDTVELFDRVIQAEMRDPSRSYWNERSIFGTRRIDMFRKRGLYEHSRNGAFLRFFHRLAHMLGCAPEKVLEASSPDEQTALYSKSVDPFFDSLIIRIVGRLPITVFGLGIPPQQFEELKKESGADLVRLYRLRVRRLACDFPIRENYFAWQAFARKYDTLRRIAIPEYLKASNFPTLRSNLSRIRSRVGSVTDEISSQAANSFNRFVLLDAQDWMDKAAIKRLWQTIAEKGEIGSRIIFRTAGKSSPVESALPDPLRRRFRYEIEQSEALFGQDRSAIYGGFHLYVLES